MNTPQQPQSKDWVSRFESEYVKIHWNRLVVSEELHKEAAPLVAFIHTLLAEERSRIWEAIEEMSVCADCKGRGTIDCDMCEKDSHDCGYCGGTGKHYSLPAHDIIALLVTKQPEDGG